MKQKISIAVIVLTAGVAFFSSCDSKRQPGKVYMPDMAYSRAYESYAPHDSAVFTMDMTKKGDRIFYNSMPANGTIKRGELFPYTLPNDSNGYIMSAAVKNPLTDSLSVAEMAEAGRLFNINCAICHGEKAAGNGPLATSGHIGGVANLASGEKAGLSDGTMFHVMTYGRNLMGSYASQLDRKQRWMIVKYIRTLQPKPAAATAGTTTTAPAGDSTVAKK
jgi:mono/diheme cytochrome c family protein